MISPPDYLDDDASKVWERLAPSLEARGVLTDWDADLFAAYCTAVVHHRRAVELVNQTNVLTKAAGAAHVVKNPALQVIRDQATILVALGARFGLTPADRATLKLAEEPDDDAGAFLASVSTAVRDTTKPGSGDVGAGGGGVRRSTRAPSDAVAKTGRRRRPGTAA
jgi:P27 family predicted phage terminase small subunit